MQIEDIGQYEVNPYKRFFLWFIFIILFVCAGTLYYVFSSATINIYPELEHKEVELKVLLDSNEGTIDYENNKIGGVFFSTAGQGEKNYENLTPKKIQQQATGKIILHNNYSRAQRFNAGDVLITKDLIPTQKVALKKGFILYRNQTKVVEAYCLEKGIAGHIPPTEFEFEKFDDSLNGKISAISEEAFRGGVENINLITQNDIEVAKNELKQELAKQNLEKLKSKIQEGEVLTQDNTVNEIVYFKSNREPQEHADSLKVEMQLKSTAAVYKKEALISLINYNLKKEASQDQEFLSLKEDNLEISVAEISPNNQEGYLNLKINGKFRPKFSAEIFNKDQIKGYNERAVKKHYLDYADIEKVEVDFWPDFRKTVPDLNNRIFFNIVEE
ncbi:MAG: hypothetical protein GF335_04900 [Candidatus Moranbacteria bacterium]|nr:hypothetical protein [Candidatus Moranbacteria bacterium]